MANGKKSSLVATLTKEVSSAVPILKETQNRTTGIEILDRTLGGGLPSGSVAYIYADAKSMAEVFLYQFSQARKTYYFTNGRRPMYVLHDIEGFGFKTKDIIFVDIYSEYYFTSHGEMVDNTGNEFVDAKIVEFTEYNLKKIMAEEEEDINIIFDSFSFYLNLNINPGAIKRVFVFRAAIRYAAATVLPKAVPAHNMPSSCFRIFATASG